VFDLDGTIVDTESIEYEAVRRVWIDHGLDYPVIRYVHVIGTQSSPPWELELEHELGRRLDHRELAERRRHHHLELAGDLRPRPGIVELLDAAHTAHIGVALATNSPSWWAEERLAELGLAGRFGVILAADIASSPKPHPAPYLEACAALGADPHRSVAFEDSETGVRSAVDAGCFTVACAGPLTTYHDLDAAHLKVVSHLDVSLELLAELLARR
jgi:putative hydrolase of the HAD superfamily